MDLLRTTPLQRDPFDFLVVPGFIQEDAKPLLSRDFPRIARTGSYPVSALTYGQTFEALLEEVRSPEFAAVMAAKFGIDLAPYPVLITIRGRCGTQDGGVHTDAAWKVVSLLLYLNERWDNDGGRLRLLRSKDVEDVAMEIMPIWGTLLAFRRSERSYHGHKRFVGERRVVQLNWVLDQKFIDREVARHAWTAWLKRLSPFVSRAGY